LGYGFLEKVYPDALVVSLTAMGMKIQQQVKIAVYFQGQIAGEYSPISRSMIWSLWNLKLLPASWLNMKLSC
jgi:hypothetical protein